MKFLQIPSQLAFKKAVKTSISASVLVLAACGGASDNDNNVALQPDKTDSEPVVVVHINSAVAPSILDGETISEKPLEVLAVDPVRVAADLEADEDTSMGPREELTAVGANDDGAHSTTRSSAASSIDYGLYWISANGIDSAGKPRHKYTKAVDLDAKGNVWARNNVTWGKEYDWKGRKIYDNTKPTIIYFHGWQPTFGHDLKGHLDNETFVWTRKSDGNGQSTDHNNENVKWVDTLKPWRDAGYNVGIYRWRMWADETLTGIKPIDGLNAVKWAEAKIWSSGGPSKMRYKDATNTYVDIDTKLLEYETSANPLKLPKVKTNVYLGNYKKIDNTDARGRAFSAYQRILRRNPGPLELNDWYLHVDRSLAGPGFRIGQCYAKVEELACSSENKGKVGKDYCEDSDVIYAKQICEYPSVGQLAATELQVALQAQANNTIFAGHSLGNQLAASTAGFMHAANQDKTLLGDARGVPVQLVLLDPYYSAGSKPYFHSNRPCGLTHIIACFSGTTVNKNKSNAERVTDVVKMIRADNPNFAVSFYRSSLLTNTGFTVDYQIKKPDGEVLTAANLGFLADPNNDLIIQSTFASLKSWEKSSVDFEGKHLYAKEWYFASMYEDATFPKVNLTTSECNSWGVFCTTSTKEYQGISAKSSIATINTLRGIAVSQGGGASTRVLKDDTFGGQSGSNGSLRRLTKAIPSFVIGTQNSNTTINYSTTSYPIDGAPADTDFERTAFTGVGANALLMYAFPEEKSNMIYMFGRDSNERLKYIKTKYIKGFPEQFVNTSAFSIFSTFTKLSQRLYMRGFSPYEYYYGDYDYNTDTYNYVGRISHKTTTPEADYTRWSIVDDLLFIGRGGTQDQLYQYRIKSDGIYYEKLVKLTNIPLGVDAHKVNMFTFQDGIPRIAGFNQEYKSWK
jgi:hypothetical protein